jgi:multimeric flavodoxin WrbA
MKIIAFIGSPRKGSNTDLLVDQLLRGAQTKGHRAEKIYLYDYDISPCLDCRRCKKDDFTCALQDGMQMLYSRLEKADLIVFGTPIYWYGPTGKMKLFIDRLRPFIASGLLNGKKSIVVTPSEEGESCCGPLMEMFLMSFDYLGMAFAGSILAKAYEREEIQGNANDLGRAYCLGMSL